MDFSTPGLRCHAQPYDETTRNSRLFFGRAQALPFQPGILGMQVT